MALRIMGQQLLSLEIYLIIRLLSYMIVKKSEKEKEMEKEIVFPVSINTNTQLY